MELQVKPFLCSLFHNEENDQISNTITFFPLTHQVPSRRLLILCSYAANFFYHLYKNFGLKKVVNKNRRRREGILGLFILGFLRGEGLIDTPTLSVRIGVVEVKVKHGERNSRLYPPRIQVIPLAPPYLLFLFILALQLSLF